MIKYRAVSPPIVTNSQQVAITLLELIGLALPAFALFMVSIETYFERRDGNPEPALRPVKIALLFYVIGAFIIGSYLVFATDISPILKAGVVMLGVGLGFLMGAFRRIG